MIQAIIFDCFGVIITDGLEAVVQRLEQTDPQARALISHTIGQSNRGLIEPRESNRQIAEYLHLPVETWRQMVATEESRNRDLMNWIPRLRPQYKTALLSNVGRGSLKRRFSEQELIELFDVVIASGEVGMVKPDPKIYELTAARLGVKPADCVFIDDRQGHVQGAKNAGMQTIFYQNFPQLQTDLTALLAANSSS